MTTQHNMPPMPLEARLGGTDRYGQRWERDIDAANEEIADWETYAAALAEKVKELEAALAKQTELTNRCTEAAAMFAKDAIKPEPFPPSEQPDWVRNAVPPSAARQPVEAEPVAWIDAKRRPPEPGLIVKHWRHNGSTVAIRFTGNPKMASCDLWLPLPDPAAQQPATVDRDAANYARDAVDAERYRCLRSSFAFGIVEDVLKLETSRNPQSQMDSFIDQYYDAALSQQERK